MFAVRSAKLAVRAVFPIMYSINKSTVGFSKWSRCFATAPKGLTDEMVEKIVKRDEELRRDYYDMPSSFPETSQAPDHKVSMVCYTNF